MLDPILASLRQRLAAGERAATATIVAARGEAPREIGARMLIPSLGSPQGTIGGGCGEDDVIRCGLAVMDSGRSEVVTIDLTIDASPDDPAACGGSFDVLVEPWTPAEGLPLLEEIATRNEAGLVLATAVAPGRPPSRALLPGSVPFSVAPGQLARALAEGAALLCESPPGPPVLLAPLTGTATLLIVGAGHVAPALARLGRLLGMRVRVVDDRRAFVSRDRFPDVDELWSAPFPGAVRAAAIDASTHVVVMTRGHKNDLPCLEAVIATPAAYIGMIGSRKRVAVLLATLAESGIAPAQLARVHSPIGLDIGAATPEEIALAIAAEIVMERRGGSGGALSRN